MGIRELVLERAREEGMEKGLEQGKTAMLKKLHHKNGGD
jgi:hypothetical protein